MEQYKVILVDDEVEVIDVMKKKIHWNDLGFDVVGSATNGVKALEVLMSEEVSMVISDVMMPEMNGFDLCRKIKSDIVLSHLPVMLLTALSDDKQQMYGAASGALHRL